jgi:predicted sugar kinase
METTEKGECFLFVNNDVQNVSLKMIPTLVEEHYQKVFGFVHLIQEILHLERVQNEYFVHFRQLEHKTRKK